MKFLNDAVTWLCENHCNFPCLTCGCGCLNLILSMTKPQISYCKGFIYMWCRKSFNLISFGCTVLDSCLCKTRYSHLSVYLWMIFLLNQTSSVGTFVSFREAMICVVILMLKSTLFYFLLLYLCGQQEDNIFQCLLLPLPFRTKHRQW